MFIRKAAISEEQALRRSWYALKAGPGVWLPFDSHDHDWVIERFSGHGLAVRHAEWGAGLFERADPVIRADGFDVYHDGGRLLYTAAECGDAVLAPRFFLHVFPADESNLPAYEREHGFHHLDFNFGERRLLPLDFYFKGAPAGGDVECAAVVDLPGYAIARIRTGQYVIGGPRLWDVELEIGGGKRRPSSPRTEPYVAQRRRLGVRRK